MTIIVNLQDIEVKIHDGVWFATDPQLMRILRQHEEQFQRYEHFGSDPDPDFTSAAEVARLFKGRIISTKGHVAPVLISGRVY